MGGGVDIGKDVITDLETALVTGSRPRQGTLVALWQLATGETWQSRRALWESRREAWLAGGIVNLAPVRVPGPRGRRRNRENQ